MTEARRNAEDVGLADRVHFSTRNAGDPGLSGRYHLITVFGTLHDRAEAMRGQFLEVSSRPPPAGLP